MKLVIVPLALAELHDAAAFYTASANAELAADEIRVIAVAHQRRRPAYWARRDDLIAASRAHEVL